MSPSYEVGYALSGGFIKGFAHLGAVQALAEYDIHPQIIAGTSAGALAGAFLADGNEPYRCLDYFRGETFRHMTRLALSSSGFLSLEPFVHFLKENIDKPKAEYYIPLMVNKLINDGTATVEVLDTTSRWFGVTYAADRQGVVDKLQALADSGEYPSKLF